MPSCAWEVSWSPCGQYIPGCLHRDMRTTCHPLGGTRGPGGTGSTHSQGRLWSGSAWGKGPGAGAGEGPLRTMARGGSDLGGRGATLSKAGTRCGQAYVSACVGVCLCVFAPACVWLGVTVWLCVGRSSSAWFWDLGERPT